ncbi:MAG: metallophosphoesterase family protein [Candidatus Fimenecus sp.]
MRHNADTKTKNRKKTAGKVLTVLFAVLLALAGIAAALHAVAAMITAEKPDLAIVTGDITYPVPVQAGTFNNKENAKLFADFMEQLGVYWAPVLGNHDSESYSWFSRAEIGALYESDAYPHCLFRAGDEAVDGVGNYCINIQNTKGEITQSLFLLDANAYVKGNLPGVSWKYDCIHENQVDWYEEELHRITEQNGGAQPKSLAFFHMPPQEMQTAYYEYRDNGFKNTENVQYEFGEAGERDIVVYPSEQNYGFLTVC